MKKPDDEPNEYKCHTINLIPAVMSKYSCFLVYGKDLFDGFHEYLK